MKLKLKWWVIEFSLDGHIGRVMLIDVIEMVSFWFLFPTIMNHSHAY